MSQIHRIHEMLIHLKSGTMNLSPCPAKNLLKKETGNLSLFESIFRLRASKK